MLDLLTSSANNPKRLLVMGETQFNGLALIHELTQQGHSSPLVGGATPDVDGGGFSFGVHGTLFSDDGGFVPYLHHCTFPVMSPTRGGAPINRENAESADSLFIGTL